MDDSKIAYIFVDEYGTPDLQVGKNGNAPIFVYAAVVIPASEINNARCIHKELTSTDFRGGYIKSSKIKNDKNGYALFLTGLTKLKALQHYVTALIVDKSKINTSSGLSIKPVFIKYFQRLLSTSFFETYNEFHIVADKTGSEEFISSLEIYMREKAGVEPTLFSNNTFMMMDDIAEEVLLQFADFYAGAIGRFFCGNFNESHAQTIHDVIKTRLCLEWFPEESIPMIAATNGFDSTFDCKLFKLSMNTAVQYLENNSNDKVGCELINYLLQESRRNPKRHISSKEIKEYLTSRRIEIGDPIVKISELRDAGVVIISPIGKKGYKFPTNEQEIAEFLNRLSSNVIPQLKRGHIINNTLAKLSFGSYNVLKSSEFELLNQLSEIVNKS